MNLPLNGVMRNLTELDLHQWRSTGMSLQRLRLLLLLALSAALAQASEAPYDSAQPAAILQQAATPATSVVAGDEEIADSARSEPIATAVILRQEIGELRWLLRGELPRTVAVQQLFRVDLADNPAVQKRIEQLEALLLPVPADSAMEQESPELDSGARTSDSPTVPVAAEERTNDNGEPATTGPEQIPIGPLTEEQRPEMDPAPQNLDIDTLVNGDVEGLQDTELQDMSLRLRLLCLRQPIEIRQGWIERESVRQSERRLTEARQIAQERAQQSEQARLRALEEGLRATSARERAVLDIKAEIESTGHALATYNAVTAQYLADSRTTSIGLHEFLESTAAEADTAGRGSMTVTVLHDHVFARLLEQRSLIAGRLKLLRETEKPPVYRGPDPAAVSPELPPETLQELRQAVEQLRLERDELKTERRKVHAQLLYVELADEAAIHNLANTLLGQLDADSHDRWTGLGPEGRSLLASEIERLALEREVIMHAGRQFVTDRWEEFRNQESVAPLVWRLLALILLVMLYTSGKSRLVAASTSLVKAALNHQWPLWARRLTWRLNWAATAFGTDALRLLVVLVAPALLEVPRDSGLSGVLYQLAIAWSLYKLLFAVMHAWLGTAIQTGRVRMDQERSRKLADSLHLIGRYVLVLVVILVLSTPILGQGYLYNAIESLGGLGLLVLLTLLAYRWRTETRDWVVKRGPRGFLGEMVGRTYQFRWGFLPTTLFAVGTGVVLALRVILRSLTGMTAIRRVQAHLLRQKLKKSGEEDRAPTNLPPSLQEILTTRHGELESRFVIDRFHGLEAFRADLALWRRETFVGATLVTGRYGYGKSTWLSHATQAIDLPLTHIALSSRLTNAMAVVALMRAQLDVPDIVTSIAALSEWLNRGPRRVITVDDAQFSFIRDVDGRNGIDALCQLIEATGRNVYWLVAMSNFAYRILAWSTKDSLVFRQVVSLPEWQEDEIRSLIEARMVATDWDVRAGDGQDNGEAADGERILKSTYDYLRLIWDYAEGSPAIAIEAWRSSLVPASNQVLRLRLFPQPDVSVLESLTEESRFQLAAIIMHEALTVAEVAAVTRLPKFVCEDHCNRLQEEGVLRNIGGHFRVTSLWWPVVIRFLRRKHLITAQMER